MHVGITVRFGTVCGAGEVLTFAVLCSFKLYMELSFNTKEKMPKQIKKMKGAAAYNTFLLPALLGIAAATGKDPCKPGPSTIVLGRW